MVAYMLRNPVRGYTIDDLEGVAKIVGWDNFTYALWKLENSGMIEHKGQYRLRNLENARRFIDGFV